MSLKAARTRTARLVETFGAPLEQPLGTVTHRFPAAAVLAEADAKALAGLGARRETLQTLAARLANGEVRVDGGSDPTKRSLDYSRFLASDLGPSRTSRCEDFTTPMRSRMAT